MTAHAIIEIGPLSFRPDRFLARVVASTVIQRARSWQSWGDAFTTSCVMHSCVAGDGVRLGAEWRVMDRETEAVIAGPWIIDSGSPIGPFSASMVPPNWPQTPSSTTDQYLTGVVDLSPTEGHVARVRLVASTTGSDAYAQSMLQLLIAGIEESYHLGLRRYQTAIHAILAELAPHHRPVLNLLLEGKTERQIAAELRRNPHTLHDHIRVIYNQYHVSSRIDLLRAVEERLQRQMLRSVDSTMPLRTETAPSK